MSNSNCAVSIATQARKLLPSFNGAAIAARNDWILLLTRHAKGKVRKDDGELLLRVIDRIEEFDLDTWDADANLAGSFPAKIKLAAGEAKARAACKKWAGMKEGAREAARAAPSGPQKTIRQLAWRSHAKNLNAAQAALRSAVQAQDYLKGHRDRHWWAPDVLHALLRGQTPVREAMKLYEGADG